MKKKELKKLAERIAELELIIQNSDDPQAINQAQNKILSIGKKVASLEDMMALDIMVQEILEKNNS